MNVTTINKIRDKWKNLLETQQADNHVSDCVYDANDEGPRHSASFAIGSPRDLADAAISCPYDSGFLVAPSRFDAAK